MSCETAEIEFQNQLSEIREVLPISVLEMWLDMSEDFFVR
ncbi:hypothetical protein M7I_6030 [Glarea lozoyensis 74030]|uniref:Uncharacterized protein n=1 Tax=Glarea lozoyensis (strain ATCC 74030 / MF5533) TaxID=1104152 RepID=H0ETG8_GLAL7|nr:hypothetical protein M7I_6030 [Glarea lozoyensis 74030]